MKKRIAFMGAILAVLLAAGAWAAVESVDLVFCRQVSDRDPVDPADSFPADVGWVYCHTTVNNPHESTQIHHDWYYQGAYISRYTLAVGTSERWRTYSAKKISPAWIGRWEVAVRDANGKELARKSFTVKAAE